MTKSKDGTENKQDKPWVSCSYWGQGTMFLVTNNDKQVSKGYRSQIIKKKLLRAKAEIF